MWQRPDSALMRLLPYFDTCRDVSRNVSAAVAYDRHYAHLLLAELLYKNDYGQTNRKDLLKAVDYFDSLCCRRDAARHVSTAPAIAFLDARAHYINGVGYYENDSVVEACKEYMKALEVMEGHFEEKNLAGHKMQFMALIYTRLTDLFSDFYLHKQAIYFGKMSFEFLQKSESSPRHIAWMLNKIGSQYEMIEYLDSASHYYLRGLKYLPDSNNLTYRDLSTHLAFLSFEKGGDPQFSLRQICTLLNQAETHKEYCSRCLTIGEIYYNQMNYDSAFVYLNVVFSEAKNTSLKKQAAEWLVEICKLQDRTPEMLEYAEFLVPFANQEENNSGLKTQLIELHDAFKRKTLEQQHHDEIVKYTKHFIGILSGMLALTLAVFSFYRKNKRNKQKLLEMQMEEERYAHKIQQASLAGRLKHSNAALKEKEQTQPNVSQTSISQHQNETENYFEEPICKRILNICNDKNNPIKSTVPISAYADIALTDAQKTQLKKAALKHYGPLFEKLSRLYPKLKEKDFLYCYLCLLGLDNAQIAVMTQLSYRTIWEREKRLQHVFHKEERISIILNELMTD